MILVTGASGAVGRHVVEELRRAGCELRALVRDADQAAELEAIGVPALVGDLTRRTDRDAALVDAETVIACHSALHSRQSVAMVDGAATAELVAEAAAAGVKRFVLLTHVRPSERGCPLYLANAAAEAALAESPMATTALQLTPLMSELVRFPGFGNPGRSRSMLVFGAGRTRIAPVAPQDAARVAVRCALATATGHETLTMAGPETYAWNELPALFSRVYRTPVAWWRLPLLLLRLARIVAGWFAGDVAERIAWYECLFGHDHQADAAAIAARFDLALEDLETWLARDAGTAPEPPAVGPVSDEAPPERAVEPEPPGGEGPAEDLPERHTEAEPAEPEEPAVDEAPSRTIEPLPPETEAEEEPEPPGGEAWGRQAEFGPEPAPEETPPDSPRPPVERPDAPDGPVIDLDEE